MIVFNLKEKNDKDRVIEMISVMGERRRDSRCSTNEEEG